MTIIKRKIGIEKKNIEKLSEYECGYQTIDIKEIEYNLKYYIIGVLYIIFDLELLLLLPYILEEKSLIGFILFILFYIILTIGLIKEYKEGYLKV